jgi:hypothetical protein
LRLGERRCRAAGTADRRHRGGGIIRGWKPHWRQECSEEYVIPLRERELGWTRQGLAILTTGVAPPFLAACINVGGLLVTTAGFVWVGDLAIKPVLDAGRWRRTVQAAVVTRR